MSFLWIKALHVIAVISWMAGLLYLPRLFVYHAGVEAGSESSELFKIMERRLLRAIMNPAAILVWVLGLSMAVLGGVYDELWFQIKAVLAVAMTAFHLYLRHCAARFAVDGNHRSPRFFRILNEIPTVLMIGIVTLVIIKPI